MGLYEKTDSMIRPVPLFARSLFGLLAVVMPVAEAAAEGMEKVPRKERKPLLSQDNPSDHYFYGYLQWKEGERYEKSDPQRSWLCFRSALRRFLEIQKQWPDWKPDIVGLRITRSQAHLAAFEERMGWSEPAPSKGSER